MARAPRTPKAVAGDPQLATPKRSKRVKRDPEFDVALGARIRSARLAAGMTQGALGAALGITYQQMQKYEKGRDRVSASTLQGIAAALGVHPGSFFDDDMSAPTGDVSDVKTALWLARRIQRIRDPVVLKRMVGLADLLAEAEDTAHATDSDGTP